MVGDYRCAFFARRHSTAATKSAGSAPAAANAGSRHRASVRLQPDLTATLLALLAHPNIRSREDVIRRYDHEVQGGQR